MNRRAKIVVITCDVAASDKQQAKNGNAKRRVDTRNILDIEHGFEVENDWQTSIPFGRSVNREFLIEFVYHN